MSIPIKGHGPKTYFAHLTGTEFHELLKFLEDQAIQNQSYMSVRMAVFLAERIRPQLREQGFFKIIEEYELPVFIAPETSEGFPVGKI